MKRSETISCVVITEVLIVYLAILTMSNKMTIDTLSTRIATLEKRVATNSSIEVSHRMGIQSGLKTIEYKLKNSEMFLWSLTKKDSELITKDAVIQKILDHLGLTIKIIPAKKRSVMLNGNNNK